MLNRFIILPVLISGFIMAGCGKDKTAENLPMPAITIWEVQASSFSVEFMLTPVDAAHYRYAVVEAGQQTGAIGFTAVNSTVTGHFTVDNLLSDTDYLIVAEAINSAGKIVRNQFAFTSNPMPVATPDNVEIFYNRIIFDVVSYNCAEIYYAVAPASQAEPDFGTFINVSATQAISLKVAQLAADTEYKLYIYPVGGEGGRGNLFVYDFSTPPNIIEVGVTSVEALSVSATFELALTGVTTLYYCHTEHGAAAPGEADYQSKEIVEGVAATSVTIEGLSVGKQYTAYFYGTNDSGSGQVTTRDFVTADNSVDLSASGRANCYVCPVLDEYKFNAAYKGNSTQSIGTPVSADLLWTDKKEIISSVTLDGQLVRFILTGYGNGVIAVRDAEDKILWSWHIYAPQGMPGDDRYVNFHGATYYVMDRNLGAMQSDSGTDCMVYQWGRKDPFPNTHNAFREGTGTATTFITLWPPVLYTATGETVEHNIAYSVANPTTFIGSSTTTAPNMQSWMTTPQMDLWGDKNGFGAAYQNGNWSDVKSVYDPCPVGYRVANINTISGFTTTGANATNADQYNVINSSWGTGASGHWIFRRFAGDTQGTYWPNTASRNPVTGAVERGTQAEHYFSNTTGSTGDKARYSQIHGTAVNVSGSCNTAYGHALRCVRYKSETETNSSAYTPPTE